MSEMGPNFLGDIAAVNAIEAVPSILQAVCHATGMGFAAVARGTERRWIDCSVLDQIDFGLKPGGDLKAETTICHDIRQTREGVVIDHVAEDAFYCVHYTPAMCGFQSYISVPIIRRDGSMFGTLCAIDPKPHRLNVPGVVGMFKLFAELTVFYPAEVELSETTKLIFDRVERSSPTRVVLDSLSELRLLAQSSLRYRRQILALKHFFASRNCTVVLLDDLTAHQDDLQLHSISHGVALLEQLAMDYGAERRRLRIVKMRGIKFRGGYHDFTIDKGGLSIYPRLVAAEHHKSFAGAVTSSGNAEIDQLLGGGLERGTNALLIGAAGVGKSSLALSFAIAAADRGEHAVFFAFDEGQGTVEARARTIGLSLQKHRASGLVRFQQIDPAELSPGEFAANVRRSVEIDNARVVVIDSLNGYKNAMPDERFLILQMHELLTYLGQQGVFTILILAQHGLVGPMDTPLEISYLSDSVQMLRYFEFGGTVRRALSVVKKRSGDHEHSIREFRLTKHAIKLGPPLKEFSGIFSGKPQYVGDKVPPVPGDEYGDR